VFDLLIYIVQGIAAFVLSLALNHQRRYRGYTSQGDDEDSIVSHENRLYATPPLVHIPVTLFGKPIPSGLPGGATEYDSLIRRSAVPGSINAIAAPGLIGDGFVGRKRTKLQVIKALLFSIEAVLFLLFIIYLVGLYLKFAYV
jgi:hypothetical protein